MNLMILLPPEGVVFSFLPYRILPVLASMHTIDFAEVAISACAMFLLVGKRVKHKNTAIKRYLIFTIIFIIVFTTLCLNFRYNLIC